MTSWLQWCIERLTSHNHTGGDDGPLLTGAAVSTWATTADIADVAAAEASGSATTTPRGDHVHTIAAGVITNAMVSAAAAIAYAKLALTNSIVSGDIVSLVASKVTAGTFASGDFVFPGFLGTNNGKHSVRSHNYTSSASASTSTQIIDLATAGGQTGLISIWQNNAQESVLILFNIYYGVAYLTKVAVAGPGVLTWTVTTNATPADPAAASRAVFTLNTTLYIKTGTNEGAQAERCTVVYFNG